MRRGERKLTTVDPHPGKVLMDRSLGLGVDPHLPQGLLGQSLDAARDLSDLVRKLQYGQRVKVIWLRCTSNPLRPSWGPPRAPAYR